MTLQNFAQKVQQIIAENLGESYQVTVERIRKNNNVYLLGLIIREEEQNIFPTIYLETFYESYQRGQTLSETIRRILQLYYKQIPGESMDFSFFTDFDRVKERICYRLINAQRNQELLEDIPHIIFLDLAICFFYSMSDQTLGHGTIQVRNSHMQMWGTSTKELLLLAQENTPRLYPPVCHSMSEVLEEKSAASSVPMQVLTNRQNCYGATCMLYPQLVGRLIKQERNCYILPCSVHEVILLEDTGEEIPELLGKMVREINATKLDMPEILADSLYYYDRANKKIRRLL